MPVEVWNCCLFLTGRKASSGKIQEKQRESLALRRLTCYSIPQKMWFVYKNFGIMVNWQKESAFSTKKPGENPPDRELTFAADLL